MLKVITHTAVCFVPLKMNVTLKFETLNLQLKLITFNWYNSSKNSKYDIKVMTIKFQYHINAFEKDQLLLPIKIRDYILQVYIYIFLLLEIIITKKKS